MIQEYSFISRRIQFWFKIQIQYFTHLYNDIIYLFYHVMQINCSVACHRYFIGKEECEMSSIAMCKNKIFKRSFYSNGSGETCSTVLRIREGKRTLPLAYTFTFHSWEIRTGGNKITIVEGYTHRSTPYFVYIRKTVARNYISRHFWIIKRMPLKTIFSSIV